MRQSSSLVGAGARGCGGAWLPCGAGRDMSSTASFHHDLAVRHYAPVDSLIGAVSLYPPDSDAHLHGRGGAADPAASAATRLVNVPKSVGRNRGRLSGQSCKRWRQDLKESLRAVVWRSRVLNNGAEVEGTRSCSYFGSGRFPHLGNARFGRAFSARAQGAPDRTRCPLRIRGAHLHRG